MRLFRWVGMVLLMLVMLYVWWFNAYRDEYIRWRNEQYWERMAYIYGYER